MSFLLVSDKKARFDYNIERLIEIAKNLPCKSKIYDAENKRRIVWQSPDEPSGEDR
jgi:hypothetical protein